MRRIPVDTTRVRFVATGKAVARPVYAELADGTNRRVPDVQEKNDTGVPMWTVDVLVDDPEADRAEVAAVKIAAHEMPETRLGDDVRFVGLVALPYVMSGQTRVSLSFSAEGIESTKAKPVHQAAA